MRLKRFSFTLALASLLMLVAGVVYAQVATSTAGATGPTSPEETLSLIGTVVAAFKSGAWKLAIGGLLAVLVGVARFINILKWVPDQYDKWVASAMAFVGSFGVGLMADLAITDVIVSAATIAVAAVGGWELFLKDLRNLVVSKAKDE